MNECNSNETPSETGKVAIVTGANSGIGYEVVIGLVKQNFEIVMACRNLHKAEKAKAKILKLYPHAKLNLMSIDTSSINQVKAFVTQFLQQYKTLNLLINNAGIMMSPYKITEDGFENQFATNYLGHFALSGMLLPILKSTYGARIVTLSSLSYKWAEIQFDDFHAQRKYSKTKAYGQSKRACLMFAFELQRRLLAAGYDIASLAAHPGLCKTNLDQYFPALIKPLGNLFLQPAAKGALPVLYAALHNSLKGGEFIGPDGFQQMRGKPIIIDADEYSNNKDVAKRLWNESEKMTGVYYLTDSYD
ncbi:oxidoreductase [Pedobacter lithocola]|uniref:Oxidoreductase n=1 Tax=Pedobacter lithocola TaxID=1908239 RepID=A0ABV8P9B2_9SPHI